jgi:predicted nucleic acid-binding protein
MRSGWELRHNLTAYDAAYVALAELLDVPPYHS